MKNVLNFGAMFQFKKFSIKQDFATMKVNTDGVLLGAWCNVNEVKNVLDIGTGTGVIALMLAQKNSEAKIDAIEIDERASEEARFNAEKSPLFAQILVFHSALQNFNAEKKYDVIVSNPPYFIDDLKPENQNKLGAKHAITLSYDELIFHAKRLLSENGKFYVSIPIFNEKLFTEKATKNGLFSTSVLRVKARSDKPFYLALLEFSTIGKPAFFTEISIQNVNGSFTKEYIELTRDFYLKM